MKFLWMRLCPSHLRCDGLNYIAFYEASSETALALSTYVAGESNHADASVLQVGRLGKHALVEFVCGNHALS